MTIPSQQQAELIRRLAAEAGGAAELLAWVRAVFSRPPGRPAGSSRFSARDKALLAAIRAAQASTAESIEQLIRLNIDLLGGPDWGASRRATAARLRKKAKQLK